MKKLTELGSCLLLLLVFSVLLGSVRVSHAAGTTCVMWIFDLSGSMSNDLQQCKNTAKQTIDILAPLGVKFGLITHVDYPHYYDYCGYANTYGTSGDYAYMLHHPCGTDPGVVKNTIDGLATKSGADRPEDYARQMYELVNDPNINWVGAKEAVHFGDSEAHWCNMPGGSTGCDPGRNEACGDGDDVDLLEAVIDMGLHVIDYTFINPEKTSSDIEVHAFWKDFAAGHFRMCALSLEEVTPGQLAQHIIRLAVGGLWVPIDKFGLLAPYIALTSTIVVATAATAIYARRVKRRRQKR